MASALTHFTAWFKNGDSPPSLPLTTTAKTRSSESLLPRKYTLLLCIFIPRCESGQHGFLF